MANKVINTRANNISRIVESGDAMSAWLNPLRRKKKREKAEI